MKRFFLFFSVIVFAAFFYSCENDLDTMVEQPQEIEKVISTSTLKSTGSYDGKVYTIRNSDGNYWLTGSGNLIAGTNTSLYEQWEFLSNGDDTYRLRNLGAYLDDAYDQYLDIYYYQDIFQLPKAILNYYDPNDPNQKWTVTENGLYQITCPSTNSRLRRIDDRVIVDDSQYGSFNWVLEEVAVCYATIYKHSLNDGPNDRASFAVGDYLVGSFHNTIGNDHLTAVEVVGGAEVTLYEHDGYGGRAYSFTEGKYDVAGYFNDVASSMQISHVDEGNEYVTIYKHRLNQTPNESASFGVGDYNIGTFHGTIGNDALTVLKVSEGLQVTIYEHSDFEGENYTFTPGTYDLLGFNDRTSSMRVRKR